MVFVDEATERASLAISDWSEVKTARSSELDYAEDKSCSLLALLLNAITFAARIYSF